MPIRPASALLFLSCLTFFLSSCANTDVQEAMQQRRLAIAAEPQGDYYIGRRFYIDHTQMWGYLRRPGQPWESAKLVLFNESKMLQPDRLKEVPGDSSPAHGYDHNYEYHIWGSFTGHQVYDPGSDLFLPEFQLTKWELTNASPGWLFSPKDRFDGSHLLRWNSEDQAISGHHG